MAGKSEKIDEVFAFVENFHRVAISETAPGQIDDAAFPGSILEEVHADNRVDDVSHNHVMRTRAAKEDEASTALTKST